MLIEIILLILLIISIVFVSFMIFWKFYFLRDPDRFIPKGDNLVSPADGKIMYISKFNNKNLKNKSIEIKKSFIGRINTLTTDVCKEGYIISIFMSPLDVHINRAPMKGKIKYQKHVNGKFLFASDLSSIIENEKNEIIIDNNKFKIKVIQVAGFVARKIESFVKVNDNLEKGQRFGLINLGSQVNVIFPNNFKPNVKLGDKVKAGTSIIAVKNK